MPNTYDLTGKAALLTGAGSSKQTEEFGRIEGIGSGIARTLVQNGCDIIFTYNSSVEGAMKLRDELYAEAPDRKIIPVQFSASDYQEAAPALIDAVEREFGQLDLLVNNLGTTYVTQSEIPHDEPAEEAEKLLRINFHAAYELSKRACEYMQAKGGYLVNVTSCSVTMPHAKRPAYGVSKHAMHGMSSEFASHYGKHKIKVLELQLGIFETLMTLPRLAFYREACGKGAVPLGRLGYPEEVGNLVAFFLSGGCDYMHGAAIKVDGGLTIRSFDTLTIE
ncbi:MAG: SDR family oxidoreductase [Planctomycetota bacterium]|jgi:3-oxoacyl-[acyl-carrier protein] reductase|nr:SDR family oxidoreductase [Planctomycetota bacterium]MDP7129755.1 SDR family oxidoreductase [Planctomycetota bacterium]MDP7250683.1 SDR family oxidoreductase [Planctomycetota bacterium]